MKKQWQQGVFDTLSSEEQVLPQRRLYSKRTLLILASGYITSGILYFVSGAILSSFSQPEDAQLIPGMLGSIAVLGFIAVVVSLLIMDWHGFTTLNGWIKWRRMKTWQKLVVGYLFIGFSFLLVIPYLIQAYSTYTHDKAQEPARLRRKIAEQEIQVGIIPKTDGACRICHKPLQVDAEFCMYCGAVVKEHPKICPNCATVALADAKWCPKCRTPLDG
jgi:hypothetical protein